MKIIFHETGTDASLWLDELARALPEAELREWQPGDTAPADYAIVWRAPRELFANRPDLKAVFNLGAGVDAILDVERREPGTLPPNAKLVRLRTPAWRSRWSSTRRTRCCAICAVSTNTICCSAKVAGRRLKAHRRESFTVGVLGLGVLGTEVARALTGLSVPVRGYSRSGKQIEGVETYAGEAQFDAFLDGVQGTG